MRPLHQPPSATAARPLRIVVIGGGAAGTLTAIHLLRSGWPGMSVAVVEPREALGRGVAFGTPDPWHRLNVPAITMSALADEPDQFRAFAGVAAGDFPSRRVFGDYLGALLDQVRSGSAAQFEHVRDTALDVRDAAITAALEVGLGSGRRLPADVVVLATGNELPRPPGFARHLADAGDPRLVTDPWAPGSLDVIRAGETAGIIGTGHTALDIAASLIRGRGVDRVIAISRHGETPRSHEDPWRPRPAQPAFSVTEFAGWPDKPGEVRRRFQAYPGGWRQALDSVRPQLREMWLAMDEAERREFLANHRRDWEIRRSRLGPDVTGDVAGWVSEGRLEILAGSVASVEAAGDGLKVATAAGPVEVGHLVLATGPDESASASPLLASLVADGLARPASQDLGIDVDPYDFRVRDAGGEARRPIYALGPIIRGSVWESIAIPEIRQAAARIAELVSAD